MSEIKMVTDELEVLAKQFLWGNNILSKQIKAIDNYNNELRNNFAAFSMNKIYNMVEEASIEGYKLLGKLKELHDKLIKVKGDFEKADNENSAQYSSNDSDGLSFTVKKDSGLMRLKKERDNLRDKLFNKDNVFDGTLDFFKLAGIDWKIRFGLFNSSEKNAMIATGINPNLAEAGSDMVTCELGGVFLGSGIAGARSTFKCFKPGMSVGGKSFIAASGFGSASKVSSLYWKQINKIRHVDNDILDIMESKGGHTLDRHVGKSREYLEERVSNMRQGADGATSFSDKNTAIKATKDVLNQNSDKIADWIVNGKSSRITLKTEHDFSVGYGVSKNSGEYVDNVSKTVTVIQKTKDNDLGFKIITCYPKLN
ncbi:MULTISPECIES: RNase A-like domain-containing protein [Clostridium]|uniref:RNase A-like domain-containing protein n=1 Tax=Clostridium TaxID=1485 RepID=UPI0008270978|nr:MULTISPECIES: RNase A-like domain-containing protein [Clostridium]PJI10019.1 hypothetical protein CUB90_20040 [Clostridium sp. CT7]